jgi:hypothetical protein
MGKWTRLVTGVFLIGNPQSAIRNAPAPALSYHLSLITLPLPSSSASAIIVARGASPTKL